MNYKLENKPETTLVGFKKRFSGTPATRWEQENEFYLSTRGSQYMLKGMANDSYMDFNIMTNFDDDGFDFYIAALCNKEDTFSFEEILGDDAKRFERITIPQGLYLICRTESCKWPAELVEPLRKQAVSVWLPENGYELDKRPEINIFYWFYKEDDEALNSSRYAEIWLPVVKK